MLSSSGLNQRAISDLADSTASEPWQTLRPTSCLCVSWLFSVGYSRKAETHDGVVTTDGTGGRGTGVGGSEEDTAGLDGITTLPDHGADGARVHVLNEATGYVRNAF